jgi:hypothetical protein
MTQHMVAVLRAAVGLLLATTAMTSAGGVEGQGFELQEVSTFDLPESTASGFLMGHRSVCSDKADPNVTKYPPFKSRQPLYGSVDFSDPMGGTVERAIYFYAVDESRGTGKGYDRLYFDLNRDGDLTNDKALAAQKNPAAGAMLKWLVAKQRVCFENLNILFPCGPEAQRPLEMMPRLMISDANYKTLNLVTTRAFRGKIKLGQRDCDVLLGHSYTVAGWFDKPSTALHITPAGSKGPRAWWGCGRLNAMHQVDGAFYSFSAAPTGDRLTVHPYKGPLGTFKVGAAGRKIGRLETYGCLRSERVAVVIGEILDSGGLAYARSCQVPVGDYMPESISLWYGKFRFGVSCNIHTDGKPRDMTKRQRVYGIAIREDKPFVFDFSNKPIVLFASPAQSRRIKLGEELTVNAVLVDPALDVMVRDLSDTTRKDSHGQDLSLDPKVTIARANGEIVGEGVMPFG